MIRSLIYLFVLSYLLFACVSKQKYAEMEAAKNYWESEADSVSSLTSQIVRLNEEIRVNDIQLAESYHDLEQKEATIRSLQRNYTDLSNRYDKLLNQTQSVVTSSSEERQILVESLAAKEAELDQKERELTELEYILQQREERLNNFQNDVGKMQEAIDIRERRISELNALLEAEGKRMNELESTFNTDLEGLNQGGDVNVEGRDGRVYIALSDELLFRSGSASIGSRGKNVIRSIANTILSDPSNANLQIIVEGHTDSDGSANTNWTLSAERAVAVVKELANSGIPPAQLTAAGRGLYAPVVPNTSSSNKAKNRRVEIILSPDYDKLIGRTN